MLHREFKWNMHREPTANSDAKTRRKKNYKSMEKEDIWNRFENRNRFFCACFASSFMPRCGHIVHRGCCLFDFMCLYGKNMCNYMYRFIYIKYRRVYKMLFISYILCILKHEHTILHWGCRNNSVRCSFNVTFGCVFVVVAVAILRLFLHRKQKVCAWMLWYIIPNLSTHSIDKRKGWTISVNTRKSRTKWNYF